MNHEFYLTDAIEVIEEVLSSGGEFRMFPKGTSMLPLLVQGRDSVVLFRRENGAIRKHDIAFYRRDNGQFVLHRVMKIESDGTYTMCGDNQTLLEKGIRQDQIIGYVCRMYRKEREVRLHNVFYSVYVFLHCLMPMRRLGFFLRRCLSKIKRVFLRRKEKST